MTDYQTFQVRDDPDDCEPIQFETLARAEAYAKRLSRKVCNALLVYECDDNGERCLGYYEGGEAFAD